MALPIRTTINDAASICAYLVTKPTGATTAEAKAVVDSKVLDGRKISAYRAWGLIEENENKIKITERGRIFAKDNGAKRHHACSDIIHSNSPYKAIVERAVHRNENSMSATDVAAHWHQHFKEDASTNDKVLNDQAVCFFHVAECAGLGELIIGRKGQPTRFEFNISSARIFIEQESGAEGEDENAPGELGNTEIGAEETTNEASANKTEKTPEKSNNKKVFITHGKNKEILDQIKEVVELGGFEPVISVRNETVSKPIPEKVMDDMRGCIAAVIHVGSEGVLTNADGKEHLQINPNVLIEIGAAMALYYGKFILVVEDGVPLPSNLQGMYESRYSGTSIELSAGMKILKALRGIKTE